MVVYRDVVIRLTTRTMAKPCALGIVDVAAYAEENRIGLCLPSTVILHP
jgi:hypothetical protein